VPEHAWAHRTESTPNEDDDDGRATTGRATTGHAASSEYIDRILPINSAADAYLDAYRPLTIDHRLTIDRSGNRTSARWEGHAGHVGEGVIGRFVRAHGLHPQCPSGFQVPFQTSLTPLAHALHLLMLCTPSAAHRWGWATGYECEPSVRR
jgi:hypothetical protein